jgi:alkaline phosphatase
MRFLGSLVLAGALLNIPLYAAPVVPKVQQVQIEHPYEVPSIEATDTHLPVHNVILMIGDGMGIHHLSAAWVGNHGHLFTDNFPVTGIARTWCLDRLVTDSAAAGTALATGQKVLYYHVAIDPNGKKLDSLIDQAKALGKSTGVIVSSGLNDATPASFCANNEYRRNYEAIVSDYPTSQADFIVGGGGKYFDKRQDGRNIYDEMRKKGYQVFTDWQQAKESTADKLLVVAGEDDLPAPSVRGPILREATDKALNQLSKNSNGFFLMVEGSNIDKAAHKNNLPVMMEELLDFDQTIGTVLQWASKNPGTLVVVTADHNTGAFAIIDGNIAEGKVVATYAQGSHDGITVPVYAYGAGSHLFSGIYENSEISQRISKLINNTTSASTQKEDLQEEIQEPAA